MPPSSKEVQLTGLEIQIMSIFVKERILNDGHVTTVLSNLIKKLEGNNEVNSSTNNTAA